MFTLFLSTVLLASSPCGNRLQAFNTYEDLEQGRIVEKYSLFSVTDWSDASAFEGIVIKSSEDPGLGMTFELRKGLNSKAVRSWDFKFSAWPKNSKFLYAKDFPPAELMDGAQGVYSLALKKGKEVLCKETHAISFEGPNP